MAALDRRETLAWLARAGVAVMVLPAGGCGGTADAPIADLKAAGYGTDPKLTAPTVPWPLTLNAAQRAGVTRLADMLLPADSHSPAASTLGVPAFVDEWISAPYPDQRADRRVLLTGLQWLDRRAGGAFATLDAPAAERILDEICDVRTAKNATAAKFFTRFRQICMTGYYSTDQGMADLGYVGNQPSPSFDGPPPAVLARLGVA